SKAADLVHRFELGGTELVGVRASHQAGAFPRRLRNLIRMRQVHNSGRLRTSYVLSFNGIDVAGHNYSLRRWGNSSERTSPVRSCFSRWASLRPVSLRKSLRQMM